MSANSSQYIANPYNLTGQVIPQDHTPKFMGNYSLVFRGIVRDHSVAVKVIRATGNPNSVYRKILRERTVWASLNHRNVLPFYGFADDPMFGPFEAPFGVLISPWCNNGDANRFLTERGERMSMTERIELWRGVVDGVAYLHLQMPVIVHGDLKPGNVLIDDTGRPRICDFGLAHIFFDEPGSGLTTTTEHTGTERYLAPELVTGNAEVHPTTASDVYALGCLGLEFVNLQQPYSHRKNNLRGIIFADIRRGVPPAIDLPDSPPRLWSLVKACWSQEPDLRPPAPTVGQTLMDTAMTLPQDVVGRIISFASKVEAKAFEPYLEAWGRRTQLLNNLCLVSKACRSITIPFLYGDIRFLHLDHEIGAPTLLLSTVDANARATLPGQRSYGSYTHLIVYRISGISPVEAHTRIGKVLVAFRILAPMLPALRSLIIEGTPSNDEPLVLYNTTVLPRPLRQSFLLTSLKFAGFAVPTLIEGLLALQETSLLQELYLLVTFDPHLGPIAPTRARFSYLQSLVIHDTKETIGHILAIFSNWEIPWLTSFHLSSRHGDGGFSAELESFLSIHGHSLLHLTFDARQNQLAGLGTILRLCPKLQTLSFPLSASFLQIQGYEHSTLLNINLLYSILGYERHFKKFSTKELEVLQNHIRVWWPNLIDAKILFRNSSGALVWAASVDVRHGTIFEWVKKGNLATWGKIPGTGSGTMDYEM